MISPVYSIVLRNNIPKALVLLKYQTFQMYCMWVRELISAALLRSTRWLIVRSFSGTYPRDSDSVFVVQQLSDEQAAANGYIASKKVRRLLLVCKSMMMILERAGTRHDTTVFCPGLDENLSEGWGISKVIVKADPEKTESEQ